jgi:hypothetical protein
MLPADWPSVGMPADGRTQAQVSGESSAATLVLATITVAWRSWPNSQSAIVEDELASMGKE